MTNSSWFDIVAIAAVALAIIASSARAEDAKKAERVRKGPAAASSTIALLKNGSGDGSVEISVDGYGSFGSTTPAGDVSYDPLGEIGPSGAVWDSGLFFGPARRFLSSGASQTGSDLPKVKLKKINPSTYTSTFKIAKYQFKLTQKLLSATSRGSTLVQKYEITNITGSEQTIVVGRYMEGDLYFNGGFGNDFGAVSADNETLYQFDEGDDPRTPATFIGITTKGGVPSGFTVYIYDFSEAVIAAGGVPADLNGKVYNDTDNDGVSNTGFDTGLYKQNTLIIGAGETITYETSTIFGDGSIASAAADVAGCVKLASLPLANRTVTVTQPDAVDKTSTTDTGGCYRIDGLEANKKFNLIISGPEVPAD